MRRTYMFGARAGLVALGATVILLGLPIAASAQEGRGSEPLAPGAGYADAESARKVKSLQRALRKLGWQPGPVDGLFGPRTTKATVGLQRAAGLVPDGIVGPRTVRALQKALRGPLRRGAGYEQPDGSPRVRALQARLRGLRVEPGPVDGVFGPRTQAAVKRAQRRGGVPADGIVGPPTRRLLTDGRSALDNGNGRDLRIRRPRSPEAVVASDTPGADSGTPNTLLVIAVAAMAVALVGLLGLFLGRSGAAVSGMSAAIVHGLVAEGRSRAGSIGQFRGPVHALVVKSRRLARRSEARYLVSDPNQSNPFWVSEKEVTTLTATSPEQSQAQARTQPQETVTPAAVPEKSTTDGVRALGYVSVRETETIDGERPQQQMEAIDGLCDRRGWRLVEVVRDREEPRGTALDRPGLGYALERVGSGEASCLIVSELLRLSRSVADVGRVLQAIDRSGGRLVALDVDIDTSTPEGRKAADLLVTMSGWERRRLAERTRRGLEAARAKGGGGSRPSVGDVPALNKWIAELRESGLTLQAIADRLNEEGVPTLRGGAKWRPSSVQAAAGYRRPPRRPGAAAGAGSENGGSENGGSEDRGGAG